MEVLLPELRDEGRGRMPLELDLEEVVVKEISLAGQSLFCEQQKRQGCLCRCSRQESRVYGSGYQGGTFGVEGGLSEKVDVLGE